MHRLLESTMTRWDVRQNVFLPRVIDVSCPYCHRPVVTFNTLQSWNRYESFWIARSECPGCKKKVNFFLFVRGNFVDPEKAREATDIYMDPDPALDITYDERINEVSPNFKIIYHQTVLAEKQGLDTIVGIGYRKAIEFLLKDWIIRENPNERDKVAKMGLAECIKKYIPNSDLMKVIQRAVWLGNDETHYERIWKDKDISDLKSLIKVALCKIGSELEVKSLIDSMPRTDQKEKNV